jgi:hypothetical protein
MPGNLWALTNPIRRNVLLAFFFAGLVLDLCGEPEWYISNAAGMMLESAYSGLALRGKYALMVDRISSSEIPERLEEFYISAYTVEIRVLYENGEESRRQWLFKDADDITRLAAVFNAVPPQEDSGEIEDTTVETEDAGDTEVIEETEEEKPDLSGFIELYNTENRIVEEHQIDSDGADRFIMYYYNNRTLVRAETWIKKAAVPDVEEPSEVSAEVPVEESSEVSVEESSEVSTEESTEVLAEASAEETMEEPAEESAEESGEKSVTAYCTDYFRYSRSGSLRAVERVYHSSGEEGDNRVRLPFPHMVLDAARQTDFVRPVLPISSDFFQDIIIEQGYKEIYTTDTRGRILTETRQDDEGEVLGELRNTWTGNRLTRVHWQSGDDDRVTEYEYNDDGDRILERNINKGVLERVVRISGDREIEELYMDDRIVLRAVWEDGRKISEERVRSQDTPGRQPGSSRIRPSGEEQ